jgi:DNA-directed RNA polymerase specialized sigma24 family protein
MGRGSALESELVTLRETVAEAEALARGVGELLGKDYEAALTLRYLEGKPWQQVADALGVCLKTAYNKANTALDCVDALGRARVLAGRGMAEDR